MSCQTDPFVADLGSGLHRHHDGSDRQPKRRVDSAIPHFDMLEHLWVGERNGYFGEDALHGTVAGRTFFDRQSTAGGGAKLVKT